MVRIQRLIYFIFLCFLWTSNAYSVTNRTFWAPSLAGSADICKRVAGKGKEFRCINRRSLLDCSDASPYMRISVSNEGPLADEVNITVTVSGVLNPTSHDWIALISPSTADTSYCAFKGIDYKLTGDLKSHPLLCHYPVKAQLLKNDPSYVSCGKSKCEERDGRECSVKTCSGSLTFHVINIRTEIEFVMFSGGFRLPCMIKRSHPLKFSNPAMPLYPRLSGVDSTATKMKVSWISADNGSQYVEYGGTKQAESIVSSFTAADMCDSKLASAARDFGWHDPGYIHTVLMTDLLPSQIYFYRYGSDKVGWSQNVLFRTPPAAGFPVLRFIVYGDMGQAPLDPSDVHYIQPASLGVIAAIRDEVMDRKVDAIYHIGDISYATGFLVEWDYFLHMITPVASRIPYMTAIGNHERDFPNSGAHYHTPDSGGECGVPYQKYFAMPTAGEDKPWYSIEQGPVHFTIISSEHDFDETSEQYEWLKKDLASVDRKRTPWLIFAGHRPMYSTGDTGLTQYIRPPVDPEFVAALEPILFQFQVDLALWGHVHNYERTCSVYNSTCKSLPSKDDQGIDTFDSTNYSAPIHVITGVGGFSLDKFKHDIPGWSLVRKSEHGYSRIEATTHQLVFEFVSSETREVQDTFKIIKI